MNCKGESQPKAACANGAAFEKARKDKATKYEDVDKSPLAELVVFACEVGGCWNDKALEVVRRLVKNKVQNAHELLRRSAELAWTDRWWALLGVAVCSGARTPLVARRAIFSLSPLVAVAQASPAKKQSPAAARRKRSPRANHGQPAATQTKKRKE